MANSAFCFPVFAVSISQAFPYFWSELCCNMFVHDLKSFVNHLILSSTLIKPEVSFFNAKFLTQENYSDIICK